VVGVGVAVLVSLAFEQPKEELLDWSWLREFGRAVADANGGEVGELVDDLSAGGAADAFGEQVLFLRGA
jgi:hypothetical protein